MTRMEEFKDAEKLLETIVEPKRIYAIRVDGRSFKKYTKGLERPFDLKFMAAMDEAALRIVKEVSGAMFAYVQSDEITVFFSDLSTENSQLWFGGRLSKWISITASIASVSMARSFPDKLPPAFDSRAFQLDGMEAVHRYLDWRRRDAFKNAITMAAHCYKEHNALMSKSTNDRIALLEGTAHSMGSLPRGFKYGRVIIRHKTKGFATIPATEDREEARVSVDRYSWLTVPAGVSVVSMMLTGVEQSLSALEVQPS